MLERDSVGEGGWTRPEFCGTRKLSGAGASLESSLTVDFIRIFGIVSSMECILSSNSSCCTLTGVLVPEWDLVLRGGGINSKESASGNVLSASGDVE